MAAKKINNKIKARLLRQLKVIQALEDLDKQLPDTSETRIIKNEAEKLQVKYIEKIKSLV